MEIMLLGALLMYSTVSTNLYYMAEFASGQGEAQPWAVFWLTTPGEGCAHYDRSGFPALVPQEKVNYSTLQQLSNRIQVREKLRRMMWHESQQE